MTKMLLVFAAVLAGAIGFSALDRAAEHKRASVVVSARDWVMSTNRLLETQATATVLREQVMTRKNRLSEAVLRHPEISPELLKLLESQDFKGSSQALTELRGQLGLGWDASTDYVLVSKAVLKKLDYGRFVSGWVVADTACQLLAISPEEKAAIQSLLRRATEESHELTVERVERGEPSGDIAAQYTVRPPASGFEQSWSNSFATTLSAAVGQERTELLLPQAWRDVRSELGPTELETLTVRRSVTDGEGDLVYEMKRGTETWTDPVRYAHYPSSWFLTLFPGGWKTLADKEGFDLPPRFQNK